MQDWYEKKTLGALLDEAAARWSAREALTFAGQCWSFAKLRTEVDRTARAFIALGMQAGDRVALWMPNRPEWAVYVLRPGQNRRRGGAHQHPLPDQ
jgi:fatty-acyl-CoA synthase